MLVQGRGAGLRADPRPDGAVLPELRRQRHVPVDGQHPREPVDPDAVHRLRAAQPRAGVGAGDDQRRPVARRPLPGRRVRGARRRDRRVPELPALHPPGAVARAVAERPRRRTGRRRSPSGSACRCSTTCSPPTTRPVRPPDGCRAARSSPSARPSSSAPARRATTTPAERADVGTAGPAPSTGDAVGTSAAHQHRPRRRRPRPPSTSPATTTSLPRRPVPARGGLRRSRRHVGRAVDPPRR